MNEQEIMDALVESAKRTKSYSSMTNEELADFLLDEVWAHEALFTPKSDLLQAVIDRLRGDE